MKKPELLMPAGSFDVLKTAFRFGADDVYVGGDMFSLRAKAHNFSNEELKEATEYTHSIGKKIYVTVNITAHNEDMDNGLSRGQEWGDRKGGFRDRKVLP